MMKNWREDSRIGCKIVYKKRFAFIPTVLYDGSRVWFDRYYKKYAMWYAEFNPKQYHTDFVENVPEDVYLIRKLSETL
jgi:hypothetical protein